MVDFSLLLVFATSAWILILTPGPDSIYVLSRGISYGKKAGIISAFGVTMGILIHTIFAALGLSMLLATSALLFAIVKFAGAAYLIYIGIKTLLDKSLVKIEKQSKVISNNSIFMQGVLSNVLNPKVALFFLSFLPQFINLEIGSVTMQMIIYGNVFAALTIVYLLILGYFSGYIGNWITQKEKTMKVVKTFTGSLIILLGLKLAVSER